MVIYTKNKASKLEAYYGIQIYASSFFTNNNLNSDW